MSQSGIIGSGGGGSGGGSWILIQTQTASDSPVSLKFNTGITSSYTTYKVTFSNVLPSSTDYLNFQVSIDGGSTFVNSGYGSCGISYVQAGGGSFNGIINTDGAALTTVIPDSATPASGDFTIYNVTTDTNCVFVGNSTSYDNNTGNCCISLIGGDTGTASVNAFLFYFGNGATFTSGTISLYGLQQ